ncbi:MAG: histidinol dehydrogenase [Chlamydiota bacterium]|nr:histidinol dehydrogenase [Chlamydiota bacterium]
MKCYDFEKIKNKDTFWKLIYNPSIPEDVEKRVRKILSDVREKGDTALLQYIRRFDGTSLNASTLEVSSGEFSEAKKSVDPQFYKTVKRIAKNIETYQKKLLLKSSMVSKNGKQLGSLVRAVQSVGIYIPGGSAPLVSTVFMSVIPAQVAGVKDIIIASPPNKKTASINPYILAACEFLGIRKVYKMGGAHAIGAMAYGTPSVRPVDIIAGPGNIYVACAKRQVFGHVGIDMVAGPSEVMIVADTKQSVSMIAADLLAQAEHDPMARTFLVTTSQSYAQDVKKALRAQLLLLKRADVAKRSIAERCFAFIVKDLKYAPDVINMIGPEHLELLCEKPHAILSNVTRAGAVFVGPWTPEPVGDYVAGPSHVLPTGGTARFFSPLSAMTFQKTMSYLEYTRNALKRERSDIAYIAELEGLDAHKRSLEARFK